MRRQKQQRIMGQWLAKGVITKEKVIKPFVSFDQTVFAAISSSLGCGKNVGILQPSYCDSVSAVSCLADFFWYLRRNFSTLPSFYSAFPFRCRRGESRLRFPRL